MRILVVGASGTIGSAIVKTLAARGHDVVAVGASRGDYTVDMADPASIERLYDAVGELDGVVCAAGRADFGKLEELSQEAFATGLASKVMGQVNLVRLGIGRVRTGGSFTLTSGDLSQKPAPGSTLVTAAGAAVEGFTRAAALELTGRYRVNCVSPIWVAESRIKAGLPPMPGIWAKDLAAYYRRFVEGDANGEIANAERSP